MEHINIKTSDGVNLAGLFWDSHGKKTALLLHMMPATKESWIPLAEKLAGLGLNVLAIDFRGHGESEGGDYKLFTNVEHQKYLLDAKAALEFIKSKYPDSDLVVAGASIGANVALKLMQENEGMAKGVALSAGLDYYGVRAIDFVQELSPEQSVLFVGSYDDGRNNGGDCGHMADELFEKTTCQKEKLIYETGGHGTHMWQTHPELIENLINFLT